MNDKIGKQIGVATWTKVLTKVLCIEGWQNMRSWKNSRGLQLIETKQIRQQS